LLDMARDLRIALTRGARNSTHRDAVELSRSDVVAAPIV